ncbi:MAG TPA: hypothetical protein VG225_12170 [Terracidiphilus sp.]|jgi:hypothetical protein|nr:hypothetical protein [Terracidiphilus sp.]
MHRLILTCVFFVLASAAVSAQQQPSPTDPYQGQSNPPADDTIVTSQPDQPLPKPRAGKPLVQPQTQNQPPVAPVDSAQPNAHPTSVDPSANFPNPDGTGNDNGTVQVAPQNQYGATANAQAGLNTRAYADDPDGDIVHPHPLRPGELADGATIRVHLLTRLSTADTQRGEEFRTRVANDVLQDGQVLIPAGAEIDGRVVEVSSGTRGGHGSMRLRPDTVILPDGSRYQLDAQVTGTPGSNTRIGREGTINAGSRYKKDGIEYGGGVGAGVIAGAFIGGPVGAVTGGLIGAGAITVHLLEDHPQAVLEPGTTLLFTLNERLNLQPAGNAGD